MVEQAAASGVAAIALADDFTLPLDSATATVSILGKKGRGKTHTAAVFTEGLINAGVPTTVLDPTGAWYGLRSSADGSAPGLPVVIFGGEHGDVPLTADMGARIAEILVEGRFPAVLDVSIFSKNERRRFATDFLETLYQKNRLAHQIIIDEADEVAPQRAYAGVERLLGAAEDIVRRGRIRGLGVTMISQRAASLNKTVLSQVDALIVLGMTAPHDIAAMDEWVSLHSDLEQARSLKASLPSLPVGEAWVWSPEWLGITRRIRVRQRSTFDSSSTPKAGARRVVPTEWARVDVGAISKQLTAATAAPSLGSRAGMQARIRALEQQLAAARSAPAEVVRVEVPVLSDQQSRSLEEAVARLGDLGRELVATAGELSAALSRVAPPAAPASNGQLSSPSTEVSAAAVPAAGLNLASGASATAGGPSAPIPLGKAEREILTVLAQHGSRTTSQVALLTRRSHKSGGFRNSLSRLRSAGFVTGRAEVSITDAGRRALGAWEPLPQQGPELIRWWGTQLGKAERLVLDYLASCPGREVPVEEIAKHTGYSATSGGFRNSLSRLRSLGLAHGRGALQISTQLVA